MGLFNFFNRNNTQDDFELETIPLLDQELTITFTPSIRLDSFKGLGVIMPMSTQQTDWLIVEIGEFLAKHFDVCEITQKVTFSTTGQGRTITAYAPVHGDMSAYQHNEVTKLLAFLCETVAGEVLAGIDGNEIPYTLDMVS